MWRYLQGACVSLLRACVVYVFVGWFMCGWSMSFCAYTFLRLMMHCPWGEQSKSMIWPLQHYNWSYLFFVNFAYFITSFQIIKYMNQKTFHSWLYLCFWVKQVLLEWCAAFPPSYILPSPKGRLCTHLWVHASMFVADTLHWQQHTHTQTHTRTP